MAVLGIELGPAKMTWGRVDRNGRVLSSRSNKLPGGLDALETALHYILASGDLPEAIGIRCGGMVDPRTTRVEMLPGSYLEGQILRDLVRPALPSEIPIATDTDARAALAAEITWGALRGSGDALMFTVGSGVEGAVLAAGQILRGRNGAAGHLGHFTVEPEGALCWCGNRGCLETVFSESAIAGEAWSAVDRGFPSLLSQWFGSRRRELTCHAVFEAAAGGDALARSVLDRALRRLGGALAGLLHVFDPEMVVVAGPVAAFLDPLRAETAPRTRLLLRREVPIMPSQIAEQAGVLGAAALAYLSQAR